MLRDVMMGSWEFVSAFCVGRSRGCEVSIATSEETRTVSKRHVGVVPMTDTLAASARVGVSPAKRRWMLYDLETMNGTAVNGVELPCGGTCELRNGDEVVLASAMRQCVRLVVQFPDDVCSRIVVKALARPASPPRRLPRRPVVPTGVMSSPGLGRSAATHAGTPSRTERRSVVGARAIEPPAAPTPQSLPQKRSRSSPRRPAANENMEANRPQETADNQQRKRSRHGVVENDGATTTRSQENEKEERERLMVCPVCLEYFHGSATLPCSHTFCGYCISNWFRTSLSCPECRDVVKSVPVRNRALDELVERLVGNTDAYKAHVKRRARLQRRSVGSREYDRRHGHHSDDDDEDESEGATRGVGSLRLGNNGIPEPHMRCSVFSRWSVEEKLAFSSYISAQFGEARVATCRKVGLTEAAVDSANVTELLVAAQNLLLDCGGLRIVGDECCQRLKIFLFFG